MELSIPRKEKVNVGFTDDNADWLKPKNNLIEDDSDEDLELPVSFTLSPPLIRVE